MDWTQEQQDAIDDVLDWKNTGETMVYRLFGYAGTGKTTIAKEIAERVGSGVIFAAFTGKAALVLQSKGCFGARTIHSLIYTPRAKCAEKLTKIRELMELETDEDRQRELQAEFRAETENLKKPAFNLNLSSDLMGASLLILDEVSMVDTQIAEDLLSFDVPILALGDPAQLPPVRGTGYFIKAEPDCMLEEIHRQAADSPILSMATAVRQGRPLNYRPEGEAKVIPKGQISVEELAEFDQIICGTNATRRRVNRDIRKRVMEIEIPLPVMGDRIICLRNDSECGLLNGSQWDVHDVEDLGDELILHISAVGDDSYTFPVNAHKEFFLGTEDEIPHYNVREAQCFDYAYAVTCHKAQGSEWNNVVVINESRFFQNNQSRWLYTALTRAAKQVTVIQ